MSKRPRLLKSNTQRCGRECEACSLGRGRLVRGLVRGLQVIDRG